MILRVFFRDAFVKTRIYKDFSLTKPLSLEQLSQTQFSINGHIINVNKGTIEVNQQIHAVEPKVMKVLLVLAANSGRVVDQETLFAQVWPSSIFSPGSIRRCIASLRKVLDDKNGDESIIVTHPKKGYRLNAELSCGGKNKVTYPRAAMLLIPICLIALAAFFIHTTKNNQQFEIVKATPITASEHLELQASVSPDGSKVGFLRVEDSGNNQRDLWVKNLNNEQEVKIRAGNIRAYAWSPDSEQLAFTSRNAGKEVIHITSLKDKHLTRQVMKLSFEQRIGSLQWGKDNALYLLTKMKNKIRLIVINTVSGERRQLTSFEATFTPYDLSLSVAKQKLAIIGFEAQGKSQIKYFELDSLQFKPSVTLNENRYFISWHPFNDLLVISDGRLLSIVDASGNITALNFENFDFLHHPQFTPDGKSIFISLGKFDTDILLHSPQESSSPDSLINSNTVDRSATLSPDKTKLAFISHRKGFPQVYLYDMTTGYTRLAYKNEQRLLGLSQPVWHADGSRFAFANYEFPIIVTLKNEHISIKVLKDPLGIPQDWFTHSNDLLTKSNNRNSLQKINLDTHQETFLSQYNNSIAILDTNDDLLFAQGPNLIRRSLAGEQIIMTLDGDIRALIKDNNALILTIKDKHQHSIKRQLRWPV